ncbi:glycosyltransferase [Streptomyces sp. NPDC003758]|uniref:Glycosyltransferase n=1 Tax=Streptomyces cynarae TaxID=2981134 RepID=A0ABY6E314_9ACTN|nr:glycosyltransferase [Streptomyces cynarae]UXY21000.1 glycosyltransferase [Streptomyces cynarae]
MNRAVPRVRLVVPTTGRRPYYIRQCLDSIRRQSQPVEIVIVGPTAAASLLESLAMRYRCRFVAERATGLSNAVNQGWEGADADYLGWLGDDDLLAQGAVAVAIEELDRNAAAAMVYGRVRVIDAESNHIYTIRPGRLASWFIKYGQNFVWQPGSLYRRAALGKAGLLDPSLHYAMDYDLHLRLRQQGSLSYVPRLLASYRRHPEALTALNPDPYAERLIVMRRYLGPVARSLEGCWWPAAKYTCRAWGYAQILTGRREKPAPAS